MASSYNPVGIAVKVSYHHGDGELGIMDRRLWVKVRAPVRCATVERVTAPEIARLRLAAPPRPHVARRLAAHGRYLLWFMLYVCKRNRTEETLRERKDRRAKEKKNRRTEDRRRDATGKSTLPTYQRQREPYKPVILPLPDAPSHRGPIVVAR